MLWVISGSNSHSLGCLVYLRKQTLDLDLFNLGPLVLDRFRINNRALYGLERYWREIANEFLGDNRTDHFNEVGGTLDTHDADRLFAVLMKFFPESLDKGHAQLVA